jgi:hypothetical protein
MSRSLWLKEGDRKTRFFHLTTMKRRSENAIRELVAEDGKLFVSCVDEYLPSSTRLFSPNRLWFARAICSICR